MESVIDAKQAATSGVSEVDGVGDRSAVGGSDNVLAVEAASRLTESHHSLQQAILKYESIVEHLERVCEEKVNHDPRLRTQTHLVSCELFTCLYLSPKMPKCSVLCLLLECFCVFSLLCPCPRALSYNAV